MGWTLRTCALGIVLLGACARTSCTHDKRADILLISLDTARWDHFSYAADSPVHTPHIDALAQEGVAFVNTVTVAPITLPAHASLLTGQYPQRHGVRDNGTYRLNDKLTTLAEKVKKEGYRTAAFIGASVLDRQYGLSQGFEVYDDQITGSPSALFEFPERPAQEVVTAALAWLEEQDGPTFVWVHLFDAHAPYSAPEPMAGRFEGNPYAAEIAYVDHAIGNLVEGYRDAGRWQRTLTTLVADHGEGLGEHGEPTHGILVYDSTVRIPWIMRGPGVPQGKVIQTQASIVDVMPTLLASLNLHTKDIQASMDGESLLPLAEQSTPSTRTALIESYYGFLHHRWAPLVAVRTNTEKFIRGAQDEYYEIAHDPREQHNVAEKNKGGVAQMRKQLMALTANARNIDEGRMAIDPQSRKELAALGYVWGQDSDPTQNKSYPDPRQRLVWHEKMNLAFAMLREGKAPEAIAMGEEVYTNNPRSPMLCERMSELLIRLGRIDEALAPIKQATNVAPEVGEYWAKQGWVLAALQRPYGAVAAYDQALARNPEDPVASVNRWQQLLKIGKSKQVIEETNEILRKNSKHGPALTLHLMARVGTAPAHVRAELFSQATEHIPDYGPLWLQLAAAHDELGQLQNAVEAYQEAVAMMPGQPGVVPRLARLLIDLDRAEEAVSLIEAARQYTELDPQTKQLRVEALAKLGETP